ncbi:peptidoglycan DD-metalloendopeptidase family protein [Herpetosiphon sp. NSE202]|uniref:peptidoglycan DD-metalloendopeptidase family protein n=1 Tax=Herpetosiphon sp. NSE202 TaxID=3351349 RepID=UPI003632B17C
MVKRTLRSVLFGFIGVAVLLGFAQSAQAEGKPTFYLPTPPGQTWEVIQGYNCGTHDSWGRLSFDLVNTEGDTYGAPIYAAADGTIFFWTGRSGSLILSHGDGYYTMYSHLSSWIEAPTGTSVKRGQYIGNAGATNPSPTVPHLHFTVFRGDGPYAYNRQPVALAFAEGYNFPDNGGCNQYAGSLLTANGEADTIAPTLEWSGPAERTWVNSGRLDWNLSDNQSIQGFSQNWDAPAASDKPQFAAETGYLDLIAGQHIANVTAWDAAGNTASFQREIWFDPTAPSLPTTTVTENLTLNGSQSSLVLNWQAASDADSGLRGYQLYFGTDPQGTGEWFVAEQQVDVGLREPGLYYFRIRSEDNAHNFSEWTTLQTVQIN